MGRAARMEYPNGWVEEYAYDNMGRLVKVTDTDPFQLYNKTPKVKYEYKYDANGNVIYEFQRDSDAEENLKSHTDYTYDALNRLTGSTRKTERYPNDSAIRTYTYDSLGNMVKEAGPTQRDVNTYSYNSLNQMVTKKECGYIQSITRIYDFAYTYDGRGNLVKEEEICSPTTQGPRNITIGTYLYDETNRMVQGTNKDGEASLYTFNGLGVRVGSELILKDNTHGYTDFHCLTPSIETTVGGPQGPEVVKADYVIDYTRLNIDQRVLMKLEEGGYDFRYVYGLDKIQVTVNSEGSNWWGQNIKPCVMMNYVHTDRLGSVVNLSDQYGRVTAQVDYDDWGKVTAYTDITVDGGFRRLLPEITYATHEYDDVLDMFYAKARMYDAHDRRFITVDPILDPSQYDLREYISNPVQLVRYLYALDDPLRYIDPDGYMAVESLRMLAKMYTNGSISNQRLYAMCLAYNGGDYGTAAHEFIQIWAYKYLRRSYSDVELEVQVKNLNTGGTKEIDIVAYSTTKMYIYEVRAQSKAGTARSDIIKYFGLLNCDVNAAVRDQRTVEYGDVIYQNDIPVFSFIGHDFEKHTIYAEVYSQGLGTIIYRFFERSKSRGYVEYSTIAIANMARQYNIEKQEKEKIKLGAAKQLQKIFGDVNADDLLDKISSNIPSVNLPKIEVDSDLALEVVSRTGRVMASLVVSGITYLLVAAVM